MRRSASVTLVLLPMLATAAVATAQPGPQDGEPMPSQPQQAAQPGDDTDISPPGMTPVSDPQSFDAPLVPIFDGDQGYVPAPRCEDPYTWDPRARELGIPPEDCERTYGAFHLHVGVIRGGFGHYFGTGGG